MHINEVLEVSKSIAEKIAIYEQMRLIEEDIKYNKQPIKIEGYVTIEIEKTDSTYIRLEKFIHEEKKKLLSEMTELLDCKGEKYI